jgi:hypothetical protein
VTTRYFLALLYVVVMLLTLACGPAERSRPPSTATRAQATVGPSTLDSQYAAASSAITLFHVRLDQRNYRGIYEMTDDTFRASTSEADMTALLTSLRDRSGRSVAVDEISYEIVDLTPDVQVTIVVETTFETATAIETFVWRVTPSEMVSLVSFRTR